MIFSNKDSQWCRAISDMAQLPGLPIHGGRTISRQEFEEAYARGSSVTIEWLREIGRISLPCNCGEEGCQGWQMRSLGTMDACALQLIPEPYKSEAEHLREELWETMRQLYDGS